MKPSTLLSFHRALVHRKYRLLFSPKRGAKPGPKGPDLDLIRAVVEMKQRNPRWGCPRIAEQIGLAFGILTNKDVVRRILSAHYQPSVGGAGPSWLTFIGHMKDSLHSIDLFRCESIALRTYWVLVVMDQYTRRIVGFGIQAGIVDGIALCRMFIRAVHGQATPKYLSSDHDPLYRFHQWQANLRVLGITEIKTVPYVPWSHPFVERLIGTIRREYLDQMLFWTTVDLESKLSEFMDYYNRHRTHAALAEKHPTIVWPSMSVWNRIDGKSIVAGYFRPRRRHDYEFAIHTKKDPAFPCCTAKDDYVDTHRRTMWLFSCTRAHFSEGAIPNCIRRPHVPLFYGLNARFRIESSRRVYANCQK